MNKNQENLLEALKKEGIFSFEDLNKKIGIPTDISYLDLPWENFEYAIAAISLNKDIVKSIPIKQDINRDLAQLICEANPNLYKDMPEHIKDDFEISYNVIKSNPELFVETSYSLKNNAIFINSVLNSLKEQEKYNIDKDIIMEYYAGYLYIYSSSRIQRETLGDLDGEYFNDSKTKHKNLSKFIQNINFLAEQQQNHKELFDFTSFIGMVKDFSKQFSNTIQTIEDGVDKLLTKITNQSTTEKKEGLQPISDISKKIESIHIREHLQSEPPPRNKVNHA